VRKARVSKRSIYQDKRILYRKHPGITQRHLLTSRIGILKVYPGNLKYNTENT
jgi:hypothetical protein